MESYNNLNIAVRIALVSLLLSSQILICSGCGSSPQQPVIKEVEEIDIIKTKSIKFQCDEHINQGMLLPVDIIYITRYHMPREVISIGPSSWFNSFERERWETRQTLSLKGGEIQKIKLNKLWLKNTKFLIIFANFKNVEEPYSQQIIIDNSAQRNEKILVMPQSLMIDESFSFGSCLSFGLF